MAGTQKKVIVRFLSGDVLHGYLPARSFVDAGRFTFLDTAGSVKVLLLKDIRHIAYVVDFNLTSKDDPESLGRQAFLARPRAEGLWLRLTLLDESLLEGLATADRRLFEDLVNDQGVFLVPPDPRSNAHRLFVPQSAIVAMEILAVIGAARGKKPTAKVPPRSQPNLFENG